VFLQITEIALIWRCFLTVKVINYFRPKNVLSCILSDCHKSGHPGMKPLDLLCETIITVNAQKQLSALEAEKL
jgi:hypothetical protein